MRRTSRRLGLGSGWSWVRVVVRRCLLWMSGCLCSFLSLGVRLIGLWSCVRGVGFGWSVGSMRLRRISIGVCGVG